jgi:hypothetical protein
MTYQFLKQALGEIIKSVQNTGVASVRALQQTITSHTYKVDVQNPTERVTVTGTVSIDNQEELTPQIKELTQAVRDMEKILPSLKKVVVENQVKVPPFPKIPAPLREISVRNMPKSIEVSNLKEMVGYLKAIDKALNGIDFEPQITVQAPNIPAPVVNVPQQPTPQVNVEAPDLTPIKKLAELLESHTKATKPLSVRLSDGRQFYKAMEKLGEIFGGNNTSSFQGIGGYAARAQLNRNNEVKVTVADTWDVNDVEKVSTSLTYFGEESVDARWRVRKVTKSGNVTSIRHATVRNNDGYDSYEEAWGARADLTYSYAREAL